jgi:hypothetical protein
MGNLPDRRSKPGKKTLQPEQKNPLSSEEHREKLWAARGVEDVYFQREAQLTWWSVLGGIAVAALLTRLDSLPTEFKAGRWFIMLYFLSTCLVIINSWVQTAWGSLVLRWPISIPTSTSLFFQGIAMSVAALNINNPAIWYAAISLVLLTHLYNQWFFSRSRASSILPKELNDKVGKDTRIYPVMTIFGIGSSILLALQPVFIAELVLGIIALLLSIAALFLQHLVMTEAKRRLGVA